MHCLTLHNNQYHSQDLHTHTHTHTHIGTLNTVVYTSMHVRVRAIYNSAEVIATLLRGDVYISENGRE